MTYKAPVRDTLFVLRELAGLEAVAAIPGFEAADADTAQAIVDECAKLCEGVIAPLNAVGDRHPSTWEGGVVTATPGFNAAYKAFAEGGWQELQHREEFGGQGLPKTLATAAIEFVSSANLSFALCPLLTDGAIEALLTAASPELQQRFLPRMISGERTGSMNLTEPQAGSDLGLVRTRRASTRRHLPDLRHQDLHHMGRARHGGQHRPPRPGPRHRCTRRRARLCRLQRRGEMRRANFAMGHRPLLPSPHFGSREYGLSFRSARRSASSAAGSR